MRAAGVTVRHAGEAFPFGTVDAAWLADCGQRKWVVLSRDQRIRRRPLELLALQESGVAAFVFTGGEATAEDTATVATALLQKFADMAVSEPKPFLYTFGLARRLSKVKI